MRRLAAIVLALLAASVLAACGKGALVRSSSTASPKSASAKLPPIKSPADPGRAPSRAEAEAFARAVNLTSGDVAGFKASPEQNEADLAKGQELALRRCMGATVAGIGGSIFEAGSQQFQREGGAYNLSTSSSVSVAQTPAMAIKELEAIRSSRARTCLTRFISKLLTGKRPAGATARLVSIATGTPPAPGVSGSFGWRITAAFTVHGVRIPLYVDLLGFVYGRAEVELFASGLPVAFPAAAEKQLFSLLLTRAKAAGEPKAGHTPKSSKPRAPKSKSKSGGSSGPHFVQIALADD